MLKIKKKMIFFPPPYPINYCFFLMLKQYLILNLIESHPLNSKYGVAISKGEFDQYDIDSNTIIIYTKVFGFIKNITFFYGFFVNNYIFSRKVK